MELIEGLEFSDVDEQRQDDDNHVVTLSGEGNDAGRRRVEEDYGFKIKGVKVQNKKGDDAEISFEVEDLLETKHPAPPVPFASIQEQSTNIGSSNH